MKRMLSNRPVPLGVVCPSLAHRRRLAAFILLLVTCHGCTGLATYGEDRVRDLSDVLDVRYGTGFGLGASVQFGELWQTGLGCSVEWSQRQWFGRKSVEIEDGFFAHGIILGCDGDYLRRPEPGQWVAKSDSTTGHFDVLLWNFNTSKNPSMSGNEEWFTQPAGDAPRLENGRVGGAVFLPGVHGGLYLNLGECFDFLCGLVGYDLANDDGYPKFSLPAPSPSDHSATAARLASEWERHATPEAGGRLRGT